MNFEDAYKLVEQVKESGSIGSAYIHQLSNAQKAAYKRVAEIFNVTNFKTGCTSCYRDVYEFCSRLSKEKAEQFFKPKQIEMSTNNNAYQMHDSKLITHNSKNPLMPKGMFTAENITDADARKILKASPSHIKFFKKYPANWQADVGLVEAAKAPKAPAKSVEKDTPVTPPKAEATLHVVVDTYVGLRKEFEGLSLKKAKEKLETLTDIFPKAKWEKINTAKDLKAYIATVIG